MFHLNRIGQPATKHGVVNVMDFDKVTSLIGRNKGQVDFVLDSSNHVASQYISRLHARVVRQENSYRLFDDSLNGVFINNTKIMGSVVLQEGDVVTFGHPYGVRLQPGVWARQPDSEYQFIFEQCSCDKTAQAKSTVLEDRVNNHPTAFKKPQQGSTKTLSFHKNSKDSNLFLPSTLHVNQATKTSTSSSPPTQSSPNDKLTGKHSNKPSSVCNETLRMSDNIDFLSETTRANSPPCSMSMDNLCPIAENESTTTTVSDSLTNHDDCSLNSSTDLKENVAMVEANLIIDKCMTTIAGITKGFTTSNGSHFSRGETVLKNVVLPTSPLQEKKSGDRSVSGVRNIGLNSLRPNDRSLDDTKCLDISMSADENLDPEESYTSITSKVTENPTKRTISPPLTPTSSLHLPFSSSASLSPSSSLSPISCPSVTTVLTSTSTVSSSLFHFPSPLVTSVSVLTQEPNLTSSVCPSPNLKSPAIPTPEIRSDASPIKLASTPQQPPPFAIPSTSTIHKHACDATNIPSPKYVTHSPTLHSSRSSHSPSHRDVHRSTKDKERIINLSNYKNKVGSVKCIDVNICGDKRKEKPDGEILSRPENDETLSDEVENSNDKPSTSHSKESVINDEEKFHASVESRRNQTKSSTATNKHHVEIKDSPSTSKEHISHVTRGRKRKQKQTCPCCGENPPSNNKKSALPMTTNSDVKSKSKKKQRGSENGHKKTEGCIEVSAARNVGDDSDVVYLLSESNGVICISDDEGDDATTTTTNKKMIGSGTNEIDIAVIDEVISSEMDSGNNERESSGHCGETVIESCMGVGDCFVIEGASVSQDNGGNVASLRRDQIESSNEMGLVADQMYDKKVDELPDVMSYTPNIETDESKNGTIVDEGDGNLNANDSNSTTEAEGKEEKPTSFENKKRNFPEVICEMKEEEETSESENASYSECEGEMPLDEERELKVGNETDQINPLQSTTALRPPSACETVNAAVKDEAVAAREADPVLCFSSEFERNNSSIFPKEEESCAAFSENCDTVPCLNVAVPCKEENVSSSLLKDELSSSSNSIGLDLGPKEEAEDDMVKSETETGIVKLEGDNAGLNTAACLLDGNGNGNTSCRGSLFEECDGFPGVNINIQIDDVKDQIMNDDDISVHYQHDENATDRIQDNDMTEEIQIQDGHVTEEDNVDNVIEQIQDDNATEQIQDNSVPDQIQNDIVPGQIQDDNIIEQIQDDNVPDQIQDDDVTEQIQDDNVTEQVQGDNVLDQTQDGDVIEQIQDDNIAEQIQDNNVPDQIQDDNVPDQIQDDNVPDQIQDDNVTDQVQGDNVSDQTQDDDVIEQIQDDNIAEQIQDDNVPDQIQDDNVPCQIQEDDVTEQIQDDNVPDRIQDDNVPDQIQDDNVPGQTQDDNVADQIQDDDVTEQIQDDNVTEQIQDDNVTEQIQDDNVPDQIQDDNAPGQIQDDDGDDDVSSHVKDDDDVTLQEKSDVTLSIQQNDETAQMQGNECDITVSIGTGAVQENEESISSISEQSVNFANVTLITSTPADDVSTNEYDTTSLQISPVFPSNITQNIDMYSFGILESSAKENMNLPSSNESGKPLDKVEGGDDACTEVVNIHQMGSVNVSETSLEEDKFDDNVGEEEGKTESRRQEDFWESLKLAAKKNEPEGTSVEDSEIEDEPVELLYSESQEFGVLGVVDDEIESEGLSLKHCGDEELLSKTIKEEGIVLECSMEDDDHKVDELNLQMSEFGKQTGARFDVFGLVNRNVRNVSGVLEVHERDLVDGLVHSQPQEFDVSGGVGRIEVEMARELEVKGDGDVDRTKAFENHCEEICEVTEDNETCHNPQSVPTSVTGVDGEDRNLSEDENERPPNVIGEFEKKEESVTATDFHNMQDESVINIDFHNNKLSEEEPSECQIVECLSEGGKTAVMDKQEINTDTDEVSLNSDCQNKGERMDIGGVQSVSDEIRLPESSQMDSVSIVVVENVEGESEMTQKADSNLTEREKGSESELDATRGTIRVNFAKLDDEPGKELFEFEEKMIKIYKDNDSLESRKSTFETNTEDTNAPEKEQSLFQQSEPGQLDLVCNSSPEKSDGTQSVFKLPVFVSPISHDQLRDSSKCTPNMEESSCQSEEVESFCSDDDNQPKSQFSDFKEEDDLHLCWSQAETGSSSHNSVASSNGETAPTSVACSEEEILPTSVACSGEEMLSTSVACSDEEILPTSEACSDEEILPTSVVCSDKEILSTSVACSNEEIHSTSVACSDEETLPTSVVGSDKEILPTSVTCSGEDILSTSIACSDHEEIAFISKTCSDGKFAHTEADTDKSSISVPQDTLEKDKLKSDRRFEPRSSFHDTSLSSLASDRESKQPSSETKPETIALEEHEIETQDHGLLPCKNDPKEYENELELGNRKEECCRDDFQKEFSHVANTDTKISGNRSEGECGDGSQTEFEGQLEFGIVKDSNAKMKTGEDESLGEDNGGDGINKGGQGFTERDDVRLNSAGLDQRVNGVCGWDSCAEGPNPPQIKMSEDFGHKETKNSNSSQTGCETGNEKVISIEDTRVCEETDDGEQTDLFEGVVADDRGFNHESNAEGTRIDDGGVYKSSDDVADNRSRGLTNCAIGVSVTVNCDGGSGNCNGIFATEEKADSLSPSDDKENDSCEEITGTEKLTKKRCNVEADGLKYELISMKKMKFDLDTQEYVADSPILPSVNSLINDVEEEDSDFDIDIFPALSSNSNAFTNQSRKRKIPGLFNFDEELNSSDPKKNRMSHGASMDALVPAADTNSLPANARLLWKPIQTQSELGPFSPSPPPTRIPKTVSQSHQYGAAIATIPNDMSNLGDYSDPKSLPRSDSSNTLFSVNCKGVQNGAPSISRIVESTENYSCSSSEEDNAEFQLASNLSVNDDNADFNSIVEVAAMSPLIGNQDTHGCVSSTSLCVSGDGKNDLVIGDGSTVLNGEKRSGLDFDGSGKEINQPSVESSTIAGLTKDMKCASASDDDCTDISGALSEITSNQAEIKPPHYSPLSSSASSSRLFDDDDEEENNSPVACTPPERRKAKRESLYIAIVQELQRMNKDIRMFLSKDKPSVDQAIEVLEDLQDTPINTTALVKFPAILDTLNKSRRYKQSEDVRCLSQMIYDRFMALVP